MARLSLIKKIVNDGTINSFNLILNMLFGGKNPELYDENKIYNKGDVVIVNDGGVYKIMVAIKDGVTGPIDLNNFEEIIFTDLFKDSSLLTQNNTVLQSVNEAVSDDISTLLFELAGMLDNRLMMNVLYRENFKDVENIKLNTGLHTPGSIQAIPGHGLQFQLKNPVELKINPTKFKIKHIIEMAGVPTLGCSITFNALDNSPHWFSANDALLSADFFDIPLDGIDKDPDKPYALDIRIFGECATGSSIVISDLMVVYI